MSGLDQSFLHHTVARAAALTPLSARSRLGSENQNRSLMEEQPAARDMRTSNPTGRSKKDSNNSENTPKFELNFAKLSLEPRPIATGKKAFTPRKARAKLPKKLPAIQQTKSCGLKRKDPSNGSDDTNTTAEQVQIDIQKRPRRPAKELKVSCVGCNGCFFERRTTYLPTCGHRYCRPCLKRMVRMCFIDETMYPPSCCKTTLEDIDVQKALNQKELKIYREKEAEYKVERAERLYCPNPACAKFIAPEEHGTGRAIRCPKRKCGAMICGRCKERYHDEECANELANLQILLDLAEEKSWPRCPNCKAIVERTGGCPHMTCTCKAYFCYNCAELLEDGHWCKCNRKYKPSH